MFYLPAFAEEQNDKSLLIRNGADASKDDKRLPPVYPGEIVNDGKREIRVWSTSGSVSAAPAPEPWKEETNKVLDKLEGVIVDGRNNNNDER